MQLLSVTYSYLNCDPLGLFSTLGGEQVIYTGKLMFKKQPSAGEGEHTLDSSPSGQGNWGMLYIAFQMSLGYWAPVAHRANWLILYPDLLSVQLSPLQDSVLSTLASLSSLDSYSVPLQYAPCAVAWKLSTGSELDWS